MPINRPTLTELVAQTQADVLSRGNLDSPLRRAVAMVYARVLAGLIHGLYGLIVWVADQILPDTAVAEFLDRWASIWLRVGRKPATPAEGVATFTVQPGAVIPAGTTLQALDGQQYETREAAEGVVPTYTAPIRALVAGQAGNRTTGQPLTLVSPVAGVQSVAIASELSGGTDREKDDPLRARLIERIQTPPQGGSVADYIGWAKDVPGVTRVWVTPNGMGGGTVVVRFVRDDDASMIPSPDEVAAVQAHLDSLRPVTAQVYVTAPSESPLNFVFTELVPDTPEVRAAVEAELADLVRREAADGGTLPLSHIRSAISAANGERDYDLVMPNADVTAPPGTLTTMGTVTWP